MIDAPASWSAVIFRAATTAIVAFLVLQLKEYHDAGMLDTPGTGADAILVGGGVLLVGAILKLVKGKA
ncbi:MAG: hypothetical protein PVI01_03945 [Gemmatimonadales bacterium]|jgi:uncharacterized SAM-binding protein YcdF (DUF218 family)